MKDSSDIELYHRAASGGEGAAKAFEDLYDRLAPHVYRYCRRVLGNETLTQDVFQETFLRLYSSMDPGRRMTNVRGYVIRIARNLCLSARSSKHYGLSPLPDELPSLTTRDEYERKELLEVFRSVVECLPMPYREPLVLREYDGLSYQEIAEILDISVATVKIRLYRAKQSIRKQMSPALGEMIP